jgi:type II pantothenate kinase
LIDDRKLMTLSASFDLGISNIDVLLRGEGGLEHTRLVTTTRPILEQFQALLQRFGPFERVAVTGGQYRLLPDQVGATRLVKISEVDAIGRGGLYLAGLEKALVVSGGSGTAMVAARHRLAVHVTGSAVGGGTLQGLGRLLLGEPSPVAIDRLALQGDANQVDLTLVEAVGAGVGRLPVNANAVNFGRLVQDGVFPSPQDIAAGLVRLVGQVIAVIAINAARAEGLEHIVVTGHLVDLLSVRKVLDETAGFYNASITVPPNPGTGTAVGALVCMEEL